MRAAPRALLRRAWVFHHLRSRRRRPCHCPCRLPPRRPLGAGLAVLRRVGVEVPAAEAGAVGEEDRPVRQRFLPEVAVDALHEDTKQAFACVYSSETGLWGDLISTPIRLETKSRSHLFRILFPSATTVSPEHAVLMGDSFYWQINGCSSSILEFDSEKQSLAMIQVPVNFFYGDRRFMVIRADGGGLGLLSLSKFTAQLWERKTDCDGVASWVLGRTIELDKLLSLDSGVRNNITILGAAEENNVVLLQALTDVYEVQLQSLQFKKLPEFYTALGYYPFESVYTAETDIGGEQDGGQLLDNA